MADIGVSRRGIAASFGHRRSAHRRFRRSILTDYFSKRSVLNLSGIISERTQKLMSRFQEAEMNGAVLCLDMAFAALTSDVISSYCCGRY